MLGGDISRNPCPFQSTLPARGATGNSRAARGRQAISIHAPRTGSDITASASPGRWSYFNPRSPHGERHVLHADGRSYLRDFNPRSPHGERPRRPRRFSPPSRISIHAPRTGSDAMAAGPCESLRNFNPRSPHGERQPRMKTCRLDEIISIHAPRTGSDSAAV